MARVKQARGRGAWRILTTSLLVLSSLLALAQAHPGNADTPTAPGNAWFQQTWERTDALVADLTVSRTWVWGPQPFTDQVGEPYAEAPGGERLVQYFDKSRMEITHPDGDTGSIWYVTNGLLAKELITGELQLGDNSFDQRAPAQENIAGDPDDANAPTYASFLSHLNDQPTDEGAPIDAVIHRDGTTSCCVPDDLGATAGPLVNETNHRVASVFWDYLTSSGQIVEDGWRTRGPLFANAFYATGFPIGEPFWAQVRVQGVPQWVLVQPFERRVLTWTPSNAAGWQVEMGNVGRHYYEWRYGNNAPNPAPSWQLPELVHPIPDGQQVEIPDLDAHYDLHISSVDVDSGSVVVHEEIRIDAARGDWPSQLYLQEVPAVYGYFTLDSLSVGEDAVQPQRLEDGLILAVPLPKSPSLPLTIAMDFRLEVGRSPNDFIGTVLDQGVLRLGYWFPVISDEHGYSQTLDPSESQTADYDVTVDAAPDVVVSHSGSDASRETLADGRVRYHLPRSTCATSAWRCLAISGCSRRRAQSGVQVQLYTLGDIDPARRDEILASGVDAVNQLETLLGPYPYATLTYADVGPNMPGGLEFPTFIMISSGYDPLDRLIYHETAHQWLYGIIGNRTLTDGWIDEGGAEFFERGLPTGFTEVPDPPPGGYQYALDSSYLELPYDATRQWYYSIYEQGARFYDEMKGQMGDEPFWRRTTRVPALRVRDRDAIRDAVDVPGVQRDRPAPAVRRVLPLRVD